MLPAKLPVVVCAQGAGPWVCPQEGVKTQTLTVFCQPLLAASRVIRNTPSQKIKKNLVFSFAIFLCAWSSVRSLGAGDGVDGTQDLAQRYQRTPTTDFLKV